MNNVLLQMIDIVKADPAAASVVGFTGGAGTTNTARLFVALKPLDQRDARADQIIARLRPTLAQVPGATLYLQASQDVRVGGRLSNAQYQFTMRGDNLADLSAYAPKMLQAMRPIRIITDVNSDQQNRGLQAFVTYNRDEAARYGIAPSLIDSTLYDAFGQRQVSTIYRGQNQYHVVMEVAPEYWQNPMTLNQVYVRSPRGPEVPLAAFSKWAPATAPLAVNHQGLFPAITISFNLAPGVALGDAVRAINAAAARVGLPDTIHTMFAGTAQAYQESLGSQPVLIATALATVFIVLGMLYESYIHPITILSTIPSAGAGALLALMMTGTELTVIALIGIVLLIGIVKKNAIMMVDFALVAERQEGKSPRDAIFEASLLRFRPILMTTMAAMLGALPLALGTGTGSELRRPLGIAIIGGLIVSQMLTLFTTPVVYLYFDRLQRWRERRQAQAMLPAPRPGEA
jgi:multidrug efflux pump